MRILLVEDELDLAEALSEAITSWHYKVLAVDSLRSANEKLRNEKFGIIILDLQLDKKSGVAIIDAIRENPASLNHTTPVFIHSGYIDQNVIGNYRVAISEFLVKPLDMSTLKGKIDHWIKIRHEPPALDS